jgi:uncharacterized repeat protein (TIGR03803 family)
MLRIATTTSRTILGCGLVLAMFGALDGAQASSFQVLYTFQNGNDGAQPVGGLIEDAGGNLLGTTTRGGKEEGGGTVFKIAPDGTLSTVYAFGNYDGDASMPYAGLIIDGSGNLYGTTDAGGIDGYGTVFKIAPGGSETVLYSFQSGPTDGRAPGAGVIMDASGNLYGTTTVGGISNCAPYYSCGTVFKLAPDGTETVLYTFCKQTNCTDGANPYGGLIEDGAGNLYGTTSRGGANNDGTVFKVAANGTETVLYSFCSRANCSDGGVPYSGLIQDAGGNFYGTTVSGGSVAGTCRNDGCGTVFKLAPDGTETVLHAFSGYPGDGRAPYAGVIADSSGNLYGTTYNGGPAKKHNGFGVVFELSPSGRETVLKSFSNKARQVDGLLPYAGLFLDGAGNLYGTTVSGGPKCTKGVAFPRFGCGTVFKISN